VAGLNGKIKEFTDLLGQYEQLLGEMLLQEKDKRQALLDNEPKKIEAVLQQQQAAMMKLKKFEQKRMDMQAELGFAGMSGEELIGALEKQDCEKETLDRLRSTLRNLRDTAEQIKELNRISTELAKKSLKFIELMQQGGGEGSDGTYGAQGPRDSKSGHTLEKMI